MLQARYQKDMIKGGGEVGTAAQSIQKVTLSSLTPSLLMLGPQTIRSKQAELAVLIVES